MTTSLATPPILFDDCADSADPADDYRPGACNIGPAEIAMRRRAGIAGLAVAGVVAAALVATGAPRATRLIVALPLASGFTGILQARLKFCAGFGLRGVRNFGALGRTTSVEDAAARAGDRRRALQIVGASATLGLAGGIVFARLPI